MSVTIRFQSTGAIPGSPEPMEMRGQSLTIGRGEENDLVLPDPDRTLSKRHCVIENQGGNVVVVDISTNGTFLNYGKSPLGPTPAPLNDGDILSVGPYELAISIAQEKDFLAAPAQDPALVASPGGESLPIGEGDFLDDLLGDREKPQGPASVQRALPGEDGLLPPLDEDILAPAPKPASQGASVGDHSPSINDQMSPPQPVSNVIPDDWDDDFDPSTGATKDPSPEKPSPFSKPEESTAPVAAPPEPVVPAKAAQVDETGALAAFWRGLGPELSPPETDQAARMEELGTVLRLMIEGVREVLMTRSSIKSEFRIEQTRIAKGDNNPLKFSISPEQAVEAMTARPVKGYKSARDATTEALNDIRAHEVAMVTGMEAALRGLLEQLDPAALEERIDQEGGFSNLLKSKKARYWEIYEKLYSEISEQATSDFQELFGREFARAYRDQLERLK